MLCGIDEVILNGLSKPKAGSSPFSGFFGRIRFRFLLWRAVPLVAYLLMYLGMRIMIMSPGGLMGTFFGIGIPQQAIDEGWPLGWKATTIDPAKLLRRAENPFARLTGMFKTFMLGV